MKPKFDKRTFMKVKSIKSQDQMFQFLEQIYMQGFEDGANADVNPNIKYVAVEEGIRYECGVCGAELFLGEYEEDENE